MALIWRGSKVTKSLKARARANVRDAALLVESMVKASMKLGGRVESGEAVIKAGTKQVKVDRVSGEKAGKVGSFSSNAGEIPRVQTGTLKRGITHEVHSVLPISRVGTNVKYGKWLEFGTRRMSPRPFMRPALERAKPHIHRLWTRGLETGL